MKQSIILGNIITIDEKRSFAKAALVKDGVSVHVHSCGSIEFGKVANMTVFDCDFLHDDIEKVGKANIIATIVDGEEVFKA